MTWIDARGHYGSKLTAASLICNDVKIQFKFGQMVVPVSKVVVSRLAPLELNIWKLSTGHASKKKAQKKRAKGWPAESQPPAKTYYRTTKTSKCHMMDCLQNFLADVDEH